MLAQTVPTARAGSVRRAQHFLRRACPNDGNVESARAAREADSHFAREYMLSQSLPTVRASSVCRAQHLLRRAHSSARRAKFVSSARDTDIHFPRLEGSFSLSLC